MIDRPLTGRESGLRCGPLKPAYPQHLFMALALGLFERSNPRMTESLSSRISVHQASGYL